MTENRIIQFFTIIGCIFGCCLSLSSQQIKVEELSQLKKPFLQKKTFTTDKQFALLDLKTQETGFEFSIGKQSLQAQQGEGLIRLLLPDKTRFFTIKHPDYGQLIWKIPHKPLRKKKHYEAILLTDSANKEFHVRKQWVVFYTQPTQVILTIDSTQYRTMCGTVQAYLPVGTHQYKVESPFHYEQTDSFRLSDSVRLEKQLFLQPFYSYLEVQTNLPDGQILLDGKPVGSSSMRSKRLAPGSYRITLQNKNGDCLYQNEVFLVAAERKSLNIYQQADQKGWTAETRSSESSEPILTTSNASADLVRPNVELHPTYFQVGPMQSETIEAPTPYVDYGWLNISCNIVDAVVFLNGIPVGKTPCILPNLYIHKIYTIRLSKAGYHDAKTTVSLKGNDIRDIKLTLKKR